ncbi:hypothetical protein BH23VER1_BH23VER1_16860 [soil metagenome]
MIRPLLATVFCGLVALAIGRAAETSGLEPEFDPEFTFREAARAYERGEYADSVTFGNRLVDSEHFAPSAFYNLGNAHYRLDDKGAAALNYRRALLLQPFHPESLQNLRYLRRQLAFSDLKRPGLAGFSDLLPSSWWIYLFCAAAWVLVLGIAALLILRGRLVPVPALALASIFAFLVAALSGTALAASHLLPPTGELAVVTAAQTTARTAPASSAPGVISLPPGSEIQILRKRGPWVYAAMGSDLRGWVVEGTTEPLWPYPETYLP